MLNLSWGVDGFGRAHLTEDGRVVVLCGVAGVSGQLLAWHYEDNKMDELLDFKNLNYQPRRNGIIEAKIFKINHRGTEYRFDTMEGAQEFSKGYKQGLCGGKKNKDNKCYSLGYQVGRYGTKGAVNENNRND